MEGIKVPAGEAYGYTEAELDADEVKLRPSALTPEDRDALAAIVGDGYCRIADRDRLLHAGGKSTIDMLRRKDTGVQDAPDAILLPGDEDAVAAILRYCSEHGIAVIPFGGGTSVTGGLNPTRGDFGAVSIIFDALGVFFIIRGLVSIYRAKQQEQAMPPAAPTPAPPPPRR